MSATLVVPEKQVGALMAVGTVTTRLNRLVRAIEKAESDKQKKQRSDNQKRLHLERRERARITSSRAGWDEDDAPHGAARRRSSVTSMFHRSAPRSGGPSSSGGLLSGLAGGAAGGTLARALPMAGRVAGKLAAPLAVAAGGYGVYSSVKNSGKADILDAITAGAGTGAIGGSVFAGVGAVPGALIGGLLGGAGAVIYNSRDAISATYRSGREYMGKLADDSADYAKDKWSSVTAKLGEATDYVTDKLKNAWESVKSTAASYRDQVTEWLGNQGKTLRDWFDSVTTGLRSAVSLQSLRAMAAEWLDGIKNWFKSKFTGGGGGGGGEAATALPPSSGSVNSANPVTRGQATPDQNAMFSAAQPRMSLSSIAGGSGQFFNPVDPKNSPGSGQSSFSISGIAATTPRVNEMIRQGAGNFSPVGQPGSMPAMARQGAALGLPQSSRLGAGVTPVEGQDAGARAASSMASLAGLKVNNSAGRAAIAEYLRTGGHGMDPATTSWCAATVGSALRQSGIQDIPQSKGGDVATSYARWGRGVDLANEKPKAGDVMVLTRGRQPGALGGHVGMATGKVDDQGRIQMMQGNTGNWENGVRRGSKADYSWERPRSDLMIRRATPDMIQAPPGATSKPEKSAGDSDKAWSEFSPSIGIGSNPSRATAEPEQEKATDKSSVSEKEPPSAAPTEREDTPDASAPTSAGIKGKRVSIDDIPTVHPNVHLAMVGASDKA